LSDFESMIFLLARLGYTQGRKKLAPRNGSEDEPGARGTTSFRPALAGRALRTADTVLLDNRSVWRALLAGEAFFSHLRGGERQVPGIGLSPAGFWDVARARLSAL
jgi:hypothetical protein